MHSKRFQRKLRKLKKQGMQYQMIKEIEEEYGEYFPEKKHRKVSNIMLVVIVIAVISYTIASFWLQYNTGVPVDSTLTTLYYGFWVTELVSLTTIKNHKTKYGNEESHDYYGE